MSRFVPRLAGSLTSAMALLAAAAAAAQSDGAGSVSLPEAERFTLDNGLTVAVVAAGRVPVVVQQLMYRVGAMDERRDELGVAHYTEHLMFQGTQANPGDSFATTISERGGEQNAFTGHDYTGYFQTIASRHLPLVMELEADRMANLTFDAGSAERERGVVARERRQQVESRPARRFSEAMRAALYQHHPYRRPVLGWPADIQALDAAAAESWYERWYHPDNAVLVVVGDVTPEEVRAEAEATYGEIPAGGDAIPERPRAHEPAPPGPREITVRDDQVAQPTVTRYYLAPSVKAGASEHTAALQVLAEILGGGRANRLADNLIRGAEVATGARASYSPMRRGPASFVVSANAAAETEPEALESAMAEQIARLRADGVDAETVAAARERLIRREVFAQDGLQGIAWLYAQALALDMPADYVTGFAERIRSVTAADVNAAAEHVFRAERRVTGYLLPPEDGPAPGARRVDPGDAAPAETMP